MEVHAAPLGLLLADDLIFISRITGVARDLGLQMRSVRTTAELLAQAAQTRPACVLLDLNSTGLEIEEVVRQLKEGATFIVGYGSHVDAATLKRAREAGCDVVLPRSKFVEELPTALPRWFAGNT
jgi:CheY-like chemotaxis protein